MRRIIEAQGCEDEHPFVIRETEVAESVSMMTWENSLDAAYWRAVRMPHNSAMRMEQAPKRRVNPPCQAPEASLKTPPQEELNGGMTKRVINIVLDPLIMRKTPANIRSHVIS